MGSGTEIVKITRGDSTKGGPSPGGGSARGLFPFGLRNVPQLCRSRMRGPLFQSVCGGSSSIPRQTNFTHGQRERERNGANLASSLIIMAASTNSPRHFFQLGGGADLYRPRMMSSSWVVVTGKMDESSGGTQRLNGGDRGDASKSATAFLSDRIESNRRAANKQKTHWSAPVGIDLTRYAPLTLVPCVLGGAVNGSSTIAGQYE